MMIDRSLGETNLSKLLGNLSPKIESTEYCFALAKPGAVLPPALTESAIALIREVEGLTIVAPVELIKAHAQIIESAQFNCHRITLEIHSSLEAVGMMAAISTELATAGIPCNPLAGYFHDHLMIPVEHSAAAVRAIQALSSDRT